MIDAEKERATKYRWRAKSSAIEMKYIIGCLLTLQGVPFASRLGRVDLDLGVLLSARFCVG